MDSWFTTEPFIQKLSTLGLDVIGRIKNVKQRYLYNGKRYTLPQLAKIVLSKAYGCQYRSIVVKTGKRNITVRIVFVRNKRKKNELIYLLTTDTGLSEDEIIRIYGIRWSIETFFKTSKSLLKLCSEFQTRSYDSAVAHTAIVFTRYTLLEWLRRQNKDIKTCGGMFFAICDDVQDMELTEALASLMALFMEIINEWGVENTKAIKSKVIFIVEKICGKIFKICYNNEKGGEKMNTALARDIEYSDDKIRFDAACRNVLADKHILAWILKGTLTEYKDYSVDEIITCIEQPEVGSVMVENTRACW